MKYEWIELNADESLDKLADYIEKGLKGFRKEPIINFMAVYGLIPRDKDCVQKNRYVEDLRGCLKSQS